jgi:hypothetical protein
MSDRVLIEALAIIAVMALAAGVGLACGESSTPAKQHAPRDGNDKVLSWGVIFNPSPRVVKVGGGIGYCVGDPRPRITKPDVAYEGGDAYIRLEVDIPPHRRSKGELCPGKELLITRTIVLRRELADLDLYDSGFEPPEQVWHR